MSRRTAFLHSLTASNQRSNSYAKSGEEHNWRFVLQTAP